MSWQTFRHVTLPNVRWGLLYGVLLCNARAMGEFGAVSVVSGHIRGETNTMPLHVEILYNEYNFAAAFAVASLLALLALLTLALKSFLEARHGADLARSMVLRRRTARLGIVLPKPQRGLHSAGHGLAIRNGFRWIAFRARCKPIAGLRNRVA